MTEVSNILIKGQDGVYRSMRDKHVKDANGIWQNFGAGSGVKGNDGEWYVLAPEYNFIDATINGVTYTYGIADYKTFDEAQSIANSISRRILTSNDIMALRSLPYEWDYARKGVYLASSQADLAIKDPTKCLFLPAAGYYATNGALYGQGENGWYWAEEFTGTNIARIFGFSEPGVIRASNTPKTYRISLLFIKDIVPIDGVMLNGLLWDTTNIADYKTFDEAQTIAAGAGKRLPTLEEAEALIALPNEWDNTLKGRWFAATQAGLAIKDPTRCLFLPAIGSRSISGTLHDQGTAGSYWTSTQYPNNTIEAYCLSFRSGNMIPPIRTDKNAGISVRCVRDV